LKAHVPTKPSAAQSSASASPVQDPAVSLPGGVRNEKLITRIAGAIVFLLSLVQFVLTVQPSVSFWDPGELSAASKLLEVPHPPGGPLFLLIGRFFYMLPFPGDPGLRMNMVSVLASACSVLFLYLVAVRVIRLMRASQRQGALELYGTVLSAAVGALAFSFSDTFWFSGVESNYFAASSFLFAAIVWLTMVWHANADRPDQAKYLLVIALLVGLSAGVHLMSVLGIVGAVMVVVFRKFIDRPEECRTSGYVLLGHAVLLLIIAAVLWGGQTSPKPPSLEESQAFDRKFVLTMAIASVIVMLAFRKKVFHRNSIYLPFVLAGVGLFVAYPGIIKFLPALLLLVAGDNIGMGAIVLIAMLLVGGYGAWWAAKNRKTWLHVVLLAVIIATIGFTTYTMIIIRAHADPPMNENNPRTFSGLLTYLNREQYGDFPIFKRRWSGEPQHQFTWAKYSSDLDFCWRYQIDHMFNRYVFWNYIGRVSTEQDTGVDWKQLFGIPFLFGIAGLWMHFRKDWKMATVFTVLFILMGYLIAFYQNQQEMQPRERDYFYPGAYFVFALWIALGVRELMGFVAERLAGHRLAPAAFWGVGVIAVLLVPGRMATTNYFTHDRSRNWVPWDYAYNILQTCAQDAILFTNGDNDTFPLWYLQDVEGIRRDVRVVCLSLANTPWYIQQLKDKPYFQEARTVALGLSNARIADIQPIAWQPRDIDIPVPPDVQKQFGVTDTSVINRGKITFHMNNTFQAGPTKAIRVQDILVLDVVTANQWKRPIYFAVTCSPDSRIGLDDYLWFQGMAQRLEPRKALQEENALDPAIVEANLLHEPEGFSRTPMSGFKFRGLADSTVFLDDNIQRLLVNYRFSFMRLALYYANSAGDQAKALQVLDRMEQVIPRFHVPMSWEMLSDLAVSYRRLGRPDRFSEIAAELEPICKGLVDRGEGNLNSYYNPYRVLLDIYEARNDYAGQMDILTRLAARYPGDPGLKKRIDDLRAHVDSVRQHP
jgi:hypothetical protein